VLGERILASASVALLGLQGLASLRAVRAAPKTTPRRRWAGGALGAVGLGAAAIVLELANNRFVDALNETIAPADTEPEERALRTLEHVGSFRLINFDPARIDSPLFRLVGALEARSPLNVSARTALTGGVDHSGPCGGLSRALIVLLRRAGIEARKIQLYDSAGNAQHTAVEVRLADRWRALDPTYSLFWRRDDGELATIDDLARDVALFATARDRSDDYPLELYTYRNVHHLHWEKLPGPARIHRRIRSVIGDDRARAVPTPYIYERPGYLAGFFLLGIAGLALVRAGRPGR
jgi:hypothetical protein